jgi:hypothetical protein
LRTFREIRAMEDAELRVYKRHDYEVSQLKLIVLNYNECLHCPILHPLLTSPIPPGSDNDTPQSTCVVDRCCFAGRPRP